MTNPTEQAARWLADCKRYAHNGTYGVMDEMKDGNWLHQDDALAAIARLIAPGDDLVERLLRVQWSVTGEPCADGNVDETCAHEAAARLSALTAQSETWRRNSRETFDAMCAMRNSINEHLPMPSLESDLLQGPENSVFCAAVAEAVVSEVSRLRDRLARMEGARDVSEDEDDKYLILKRGMYYRPNRQGYTSSPAEAGLYTLAQAVFLSHPNGPDGPRDGMSFVPVAAITDGGSNG